MSRPTLSRVGFTLVELLVVMCILALLAAMLMPMVSAARRSAANSATQSILRIVDAGLRAFRLDTGTFPFEDHTGGYPVPNRLGRHLAMEPDDVARNALDVCLRQATDAYRFGSHCITAAEVDARETGSAALRALHAGIASQLGEERARALILAGAPQVQGVGARSGQPVVAGALPGGWRGDYLRGELEARYVDGEAIIDAYRHPIIYVFPTFIGRRSVWPPSGLYEAGDTARTANVPVLADAYGLAPRYRKATLSRDGDLIATAGPAWCEAFELWSAGRDGMAAAVRSDAINRDNLSAEPYERDLR